MLIAAIVAALPACEVSSEGFFESVGGTTYFGPDSGGGVPSDGGSDSGADSSGGEFPPDAQACDFEGSMTSCSDDVDCCGASQPPHVLVPGACPGAGYPFNWSCNAGDCLHENNGGANGCDDHADCSDLIEGYVCVIDSGKGRCAPGCASSSECADIYNLPPQISCHFLSGTPLGTVGYCSHGI